MDTEVLLNQLMVFGLSFVTILSELLFYSIVAWVICTWLILFGLLRPKSLIFTWLTGLVTPILRPFSWAKVGPLDLAPVAAILALSYVSELLRSVLRGFLG